MNNRSVSGVTAQVWQGPLTERAQIHADRKIDQLQSPTTEIVEVARIREEAQFAANVGEVAKRHERVGHIARRLGSTALLMEGAR